MMKKCNERADHVLSDTELNFFRNAALGCRGLKSFATIRTPYSVIEKLPIIVRAAYPTYMTATLSHRENAGLVVFYTYQDIASGDVRIDSLDRLVFAS